METGTAVEDMLRSKFLYKFELGLLKVIPMMVALGFLFNVLLSHFGIETDIISHLIFFLILLFLYISSFAFHYCVYHRMFLYYILVNHVLTLIDYYWGIPISDARLFEIHLIIAGIFLFVILYLKMKLCKHSRKG